MSVKQQKCNIDTE